MSPLRCMSSTILEFCHATLSRARVPDALSTTAGSRESWRNSQLEPGNYRIGSAGRINTTVLECFGSPLLVGGNGRHLESFESCAGKAPHCWGRQKQEAGGERRWRKACGNHWLLRDERCSICSHLASNDGKGSSWTAGKPKQVRSLTCGHGVTGGTRSR